MKKHLILLLFSTFFILNSVAQDNQTIIQNIVAEAEQNSQTQQLAFELIDLIGPRLVGTPGMEKAADWAVAKFNSWGITAEKQNFGTWRGWERGITHIDLIEPRVRTLAGMQLAWSAPTPKKELPLKWLFYRKT